MGYVYHISIRPHVSQQANKAALVELYEFLGDACLIKGIVIEIIPDEHISRNTSNMFLNKGILFSEIHDPVRGERWVESRVGNECVSRWRSRWSPYHEKKKRYEQSKSISNTVYK